MTQIDNPWRLSWVKRGPRRGFVSSYERYPGEVEARKAFRNYVSVKGDVVRIVLSHYDVAHKRWVEIEQRHIQPLEG